MDRALRQVLAEDPHVAYALLFGSRARGTAPGASDVDVAIELTGARMEPLALGALVSRLEQASGRTVDLLVLDEAPAVAYRVFRDGRPLVVKDPHALAARKARAVLEYLDFRPLEELAAGGVLAAAAHGRMTDNAPAPTSSTLETARCPARPQPRTIRPGVRRRATRRSRRSGGHR